ncbi:MAG TPA: di-heme oxidoredictase family protein [Burkholderiaceae bacterium]|nr:di-heme oxidoredictase family protein [Burkholderiaceae bacterium]
MRRVVGLGAVVALLGAPGCDGVATAAAPAPSAAPAALHPWDERALPDHLDFDAFVGADDAALQKLIERGGVLFQAKFTRLDGAGRPMATQAIVPTKRKRAMPFAFQRTGGPDADACAGCHNDPVPGGAGDIVANVFVSEGFESSDFDSLDPQFSNERGTTPLQGDGLIELLAREMSADLQAVRRDALRRARSTNTDVSLPLASKGVSFGSIRAHPAGTIDLGEIDGVDTDLVVRPFSQKGVFTSLRQFTINALNQHHGMEATERFGARWTGNADFDGDGMNDEITSGDVSAMVAWQATLAPPGRAAGLPASWVAAASKGEGLFERIGCTGCHRPALPLDSLVFRDPGPSDMAGTLRAGEVPRPIEIDLGRFAWAQHLARDAKGRVLVPLYADLKRHVISDTGTDKLGNELLAQRFVERDTFRTAFLWGVGSTAPYGHRGDITTIDEAIRAHAGEGRASREAYETLGDEDRSSIIAFLRSLVIPKAPDTHAFAHGGAAKSAAGS